MPKKRDRRGEVNGDLSSSAAESHTNAASAAGHQMSDESRGEGFQHSRDGSQAQRKERADLGQWGQAVTELVQSMGTTQEAINALHIKFRSHLDDIRQVEETRNRLSHLEKSCVNKDEEVVRLTNTVTTLRGMSQKEQHDLGEAQARLVRERTELKEERAKIEKRVTMTIAEERRELELEIKKLITKQGESYEKRRKELEDEFAHKRSENETRATALDLQVRELSTDLRQANETVDSKSAALQKSKNENDVLTRATQSFKQETLDLKKELAEINAEFSVDSKSVDYFIERFAALYTSVEEISQEYFHDLEGKDLEEVHKALAVADSCFRCVPIDNTQDSRDLRTAHAQRIISGAICEHVWRPLQCDYLQLYPQLGVLLRTVLDEVERSSPRRAANTWMALTVRALQTVAVDADSDEQSGPKRVPRPHSTRATSVVNEVLKVLLPLVNLSQKETLQAKLLSLADAAIEVWIHAETGELKIIVYPELDRAQHEEWRCPQFDPISAPDHEREDAATSSLSCSTIFSLFPRIVAQQAANSPTPSTMPPGGWPAEPEQVCIHPGRGLPEWSYLVVRGNHEQEEQQEYMRKAVENAKKELQNSRTSRRVSRGSLGAGLMSPSEQWKPGSALTWSEE